MKHLALQNNPIFTDLSVLVLVGGSENDWRQKFRDDGNDFFEAAVAGEVKTMGNGFVGNAKFRQLYREGWTGGDCPLILIQFSSDLFDTAFAPDLFACGVICHESLHAAQHIMEHYEIPYHEKEFFARIQQWLFTAISEWAYENFLQDDERMKDK